MTTKPKEKAMPDPTKSLEVGHVVALSIHRDSAPGACYVGQIEAMDEHGIRLTLLDALLGTFQGFDLWVSWKSMLAALVCTPQHSMHEFPRVSDQWQEALRMAKERAELQAG